MKVYHRRRKNKGFYRMKNPKIYADYPSRALLLTIAESAHPRAHCVATFTPCGRLRCGAVSDNRLDGDAFLSLARSISDSSDGFSFLSTIRAPVGESVVPISRSKSLLLSAFRRSSSPSLWRVRSFSSGFPHPSLFHAG